MIYGRKSRSDHNFGELGIKLDCQKQLELGWVLRSLLGAVAVGNGGRGQRDYFTYTGTDNNRSQDLVHIAHLPLAEFFLRQAESWKNIMAKLLIKQSCRL